MTTRETVEKMPEKIRKQLENLRGDYKHPYMDKSETRARLYWYLVGLRDAGLITERERQTLFVYGTV